MNPHDAFGIELAGAFLVFVALEVLIATAFAYFYPRQCARRERPVESDFSETVLAGALIVFACTAFLFVGILCASVPMVH